MLPTRRWIAFGFSLAAGFLLAQSLPAQIAASAPIRHHKSHKKVKPLVLPPLPGGPLSQLPMDQIPSTPAKVSFQGGLLSISAQNSTLGEILREVRRLTGASIDIPAGSGANERVVTHLGPGAPRDVLVGLLNGSSFNYVMLGSSSDPSAVSSVVLTSKPSATGETESAANVYQNDSAPPARFPQPMPFNQQQVMIQRNGPQPGGMQAAPAGAAAAEDDSKDDEDNADDNADDQAQPAQPDAAAIQNQSQPDQSQPNAGPKTPEQILEMLRRQQQQPQSVVTPDGQPPPPQQ